MGKLEKVINRGKKMTKRNLLSIEVDIEKIDMIIKNNGLTDAKFSESLGYEKSFLKHIRERKAISKPAYILIQKIYGVDVQKAKEEPTPVKEEDSSKTHVEVMLSQFAEDRKTLINMVDSLDRNVEDVKNVLCHILEKLS